MFVIGADATMPEAMANYRISTSPHGKLCFYLSIEIRTRTTITGLAWISSLAFFIALVDSGHIAVPASGTTPTRYLQSFETSSISAGKILKPTSNAPQSLH